MGFYDKSPFRAISICPLRKQNNGRNEGNNNLKLGVPHIGGKVSSGSSVCNNYWIANVCGYLKLHCGQHIVMDFLMTLHILYVYVPL